MIIPFDNNIQADKTAEIVMPVIFMFINLNNLIANKLVFRAIERSLAVLVSIIWEKYQL